MPGFSLPGPLCVISNALPVDGGTRPVSAMPPPVTVGVNLRHRLSEQDMALVRQTGKSSDLGFLVRPLGELQTLRALHGRRQIDAAFETGANSWAAEFERAVVAHLDELIQGAQTPKGRALERVTLLLADEAAKPGTISDARFKEAVGIALAHEHERELRGDSAGSGPTMTVVGQVMTVVADRHRKSLQNLIARGRANPAAASDADLQAAVGEVLGDAHQAQLLGLDDDGETMRLVLEASQLSAQRHIEALRGLIQQLSRPGSMVSDTTVEAVVRQVLGDSHQRQLLGVDDGRETGELIGQLMQLQLARKVAAVNAAYDRGAPASEIARLEADYAAAKRQASMLGVPVAEGRVGLGRPRLL
jgi:hypothetical protein